MATKKKLLQAAAGAAGGAGLNVEDVFSTYLYTGTNSARTITNGIDLAGEGGLVWSKTRSVGVGHALVDTETGPQTYLVSETTAALRTDSYATLGLTAFNSDGYDLGVDTNSDRFNRDTREYASWTFRKAPKFFDVITYSGTGSNQTISHNLGSTPGMIVVKALNNSGDAWYVWHRSIPQFGTNPQYRSVLFLDSTSAYSNYSIQTAQPDDSNIYVGSDWSASGYDYVMYVFAHNDGDGEFGSEADADIIKCGSYTGTGSSGLEIDLGFEPQWVLTKRADTAGYNWTLQDNMRSMTDTDYAWLYADTSNAEGAGTISGGFAHAQPTGYIINGLNDGVNASGGTYIYIAIRRGPMAVPESATDVYKTIAYSGTSAARHLDTGFVTDLEIIQSRSSAETWEPSFRTRLTSTGNRTLNSSSTAAEYNWGTPVDTELNTYQHGTSREGAYFNSSGFNLVSHQFSRAPNFFDVVAYTGNGTAGRTVSHNLGVAPEMMWVKRRSTTGEWAVYHSGVDASAPEDYYLLLSATNARATSTTVWNDTAPTSDVFSLGTIGWVNASGHDYIAYLFASLDGVSKVFSVTKSSGSDASVNCGFSSGPRFVMLKRTDSTGDWYVWDSERGIVAGNDPYLLLNSTAAEVTSTDYIDPTSNGFTIVNGGLADGDYIGYSVA